MRTHLKIPIRQPFRFPVDKKNNLWNRILLSAILLVVLTILGACASSETAQNSENAITPEIDQLINDYFVSYNNYDSDALQALITERYELVAVDSSLSGSIIKCDSYNAKTMLSDVAGYNKRNEYHFERLGEPIMTGTGPWLVSQVIIETNINNPDGFEGISTLTIVEEGGQLKIDSDIFVAYEIYY